MSNKFKCGNCSTIQEEKLFSDWNYDIRYNCATCGPLCKDCHSTSLWSYGECNNCGDKAKKEDYRNGDWK